MLNSENELILQFALEATIYISPFDEGLNFKEIIEIGERLKLQEGELKDSLKNLQNRNDVETYWGDNKFKLSKNYVYFSLIWIRFDPDPIGLELRIKILNVLIRELKKQGSTNFSIFVSGLVNELLAENSSHSKKQIMAFLRLASFSNLISFSEDLNHIVKVNSNIANLINTTTSNQNPRSHSNKFHQVLKITDEVIQRRKFKLPTSSDPLKGFEDILNRLSASNFLFWWQLNVSELQSLDYKRFPTSILLLSCALCEGALSFLIYHLRDHEYKMIKGLDQNPKHWKFSNLLQAASSGTNPLLKDEILRKSLESMNTNRKRIHPASYFEGGGAISDLKPEQAKVAYETTESLIRLITDWVLLNKIGK